MSAQDAINESVKAAKRVIREQLFTLAKELRVRIRELDTKDGVFVKDQARATLALADDVRELARSLTPNVTQTLVSNLSDVLRETLADHPELGSYRPQITAELLRLFRGGAEEVARVLVDTAHAEVTRAVQDVVVSGARLEDVAEPVARALNTTRRRAVTAVERAVREFHEVALKEMGKRSELDLVYLYVGPGSDSPNVRDYCRVRAGKLLTQEQADALNPRERFNCRHSLAPVLPGTVDAELFEG